MIDSAAEFSDNIEVNYRIIPFDETEGNCNTSTTSLLKNAGVSDKEIKRIGAEIKGIKQALELINHGLRRKENMSWKSKRKN